MYRTTPVCGRRCERGCGLHGATAPMLSRADLRPYQEHAIEFIKAKRNCALWVDMGLGKTVVGLTAFADLQDRCEAAKLLVIAPKRVARKAWSDEITEWTHLGGLRSGR